MPYQSGNIGLTWNCIDFENGIIHIKKQLTPPRKKGGGKYYWSALKNNRTRTIFPAPFVMDVLKHHKAVQAAQKLAAGSLWDEGDFPGLVFTHPNGYHYIQPTIWKEFQKILKKAGLNHYRVHDLRHTFAVNSLKAGDDVKTLQDNMGHFSAAFTLDKYGHVVDEMKKTRASLISLMVPMARVWQRCAMVIPDRIGNSREAETYCLSLLAGERIENFFVIALNAQCKILGRRQTQKARFRLS